MMSAGRYQEVDCCENDCIFDDRELDQHRMEDFITDKALLTTDVRYLSDDLSQIPTEDLILFPHRLFAFVLKDRKWVVVDVNHTVIDDDKIDKGERGWDSLVLEEGHKEMVLSLVQAHLRKRSENLPKNDPQVDLIRGKGKGLIILLHGAPGVGKTSTAECVAEICKRPLYPITCGDLGITAEDVEARLNRIFVQAQKWNCVLLLDEADVFLSQRGQSIKHNSIVSVFLRVLEYYQGILFLTTNRVGRMDEAFRSRIHMSLYYRPLNKQSTLNIFHENIKLMKRRYGVNIKVKEQEIEKFAKRHFKTKLSGARWYGRQIRNAFHVAVALAENDAIEKIEKAKKKGLDSTYQPVLRTKHFEKVEKASIKFDSYFHAVIGMDHSALAEQSSLRKDDWNPKHDSHYQKKRFSKAHRHKKTQGAGFSESSESSEDDDISPDGSRQSHSSLGRSGRSEYSDQDQEYSHSRSSDGSDNEPTERDRREKDTKRSRGKESKYKDKHVPQRCEGTSKKMSEVNVRNRHQS